MSKDWFPMGQQIGMQGMIDPYAAKREEERAKVRKAFIDACAFASVVTLTSGKRALLINHQVIELASDDHVLWISECLRSNTLSQRTGEGPGS